MIAIQTKYISPSNTRGARIKAWHPDGASVTISFPHQFSYERCHFQAVKALIEKLGLQVDSTDMRYGSVKNGYVFCFACSIVKE